MKPYYQLLFAFVLIAVSASCKKKDAVSSASNLFPARQVTAQYAEAVRRHPELIAADREREQLERRLGAEHPEALRKRVNMARWLAHAEEFAAGENECRAVLGEQGRLLGAEHRDTLTTRIELAHVLGSQKRHVEQEAEIRMVLAIRERVLGSAHPDTIQGHVELARFYGYTDQNAERLKEYDTAIALQTKALGDEHPDTLNTRLERTIFTPLSDRLRDLRAIAEARDRILGPDHSDSLHVRLWLGSDLITSATSNPQLRPVGLAEIRSVLVRRERVLGPNHPTTVENRGELASQLWLGGSESEQREARELAERTLAEAQKMPGDQGAYAKTKAELVLKWVREAGASSSSAATRANTPALVSTPTVATTTIQAPPSAEPSASPPRGPSGRPTPPLGPDREDDVITLVRTLPVFANSPNNLYSAHYMSSSDVLTSKDGQVNTPLPVPCWVVPISISSPGTNLSVRSNFGILVKPDGAMMEIDYQAAEFGRGRVFYELGSDGRRLATAGGGGTNIGGTTPPPRTFEDQCPTCKGSGTRDYLYPYKNWYNMNDTERAAAQAELRLPCSRCNGRGHISR